MAKIQKRSYLYHILIKYPNIMYRLILTAILILMLPVKSLAENRNIFVIPVKGEINAATQRTLKKGLDDAKIAKADFVIIHINTYGGAVDAADSMRSALLRYNIPSAAFIDNQAVSAGALISIACDSIYMRTGSTIGAATVVNPNRRADAGQISVFYEGNDEVNSAGKWTQSFNSRGYGRSINIGTGDCRQYKGSQFYYGGGNNIRILRRQGRIY